jgi:hypothetical protein
MGLVVHMLMVGFFKTQTLHNDENWAFGNNPGWDLQTRHNFSETGWEMVNTHWDIVPFLANSEW